MKYDKRNIFIAHSITILLWSSAFPSIRAGLSYFSPEHLSLFRLLVGSVTLLILAFFLKIRLPEVKDIPPILLLGFLGFSVYHTALNYGEQTVTAGIASLLVSTTPIFTALLLVILFRQNMGWRKWLGAIISFAGVVFISIGGTEENVTLHVGVLLILVASFSECIYFVFQQRYLKKYGIVPFTMYAIWSGTIFMIFYSPGLSKAITEASLEAILIVVYLGIFPTVIPYFTLAYVTSRTGAAEATSTLYLTPVFAFVIAWVWLGETPTIYAVIGGFITLIGVILANKVKQKSNSCSLNKQKNVTTL